MSTPQNDLIQTKLNLLSHTGYLLEGIVGRGSTSVVVSANKMSKKDATTPQKRAIKIFNKGHTVSYHKEKHALRLLRDSEFIVRGDEFYNFEDNCYIAMEVCDGSLADLFVKGTRAPEKIAFDIFRHMAKGLYDAHTRGIYHHDVKLENFLISSDEKIKLADFGFSVTKEDGMFLTYSDQGPIVTSKYTPGSPGYSSLQVLSKQPHSAALNDIFGLGACLYQILCGRLPFCKMNDTICSLRRNLLAHAVDPSSLYFPDDVSLEAKDMVLGLLAIQEHNRFGWDDILSHDWLLKGEEMLSV